MAQKNSIKIVKIQPQIDDTKARFGDDYRGLLKELRSLYKREKYSEFKNLLPLIAQIPILIVVFRLVRDTELDIVISSELIGILSAISAFIMCFVQNRLNPLVREQGFFSQWGTAILLTMFSAYLAYASPVGVGIYWIFSNTGAIGVAFICNAIYNPKKYIDYDKRTKKKVKKKEDKELKKKYRLREKEDTRMFFSVQKELVFYSERSGFYKYFKSYIEYILENTDIVVHYVTSDYDDQVFDIKHARFKAYYCGPSSLITLLMKMDAEVVIMTMPDLEKYQYKRSLVKKDIEYIYVDHGFGSVNLMLRKRALDHFDTVFCYGPSYNKEIREMEQLYKTKEKKLVDVNFGLFDTMIKEYKSSKNKKKTVLIAPSWQKDNILETCIDEIMEQLINCGYNIIIRPHPEFIKRFEARTKALIEKYGSMMQTDFSDNKPVLNSDILITDWSTISMEFSFVTKKPCIFINTPMKISNEEYEKISIKPIDLELRSKIGIELELDELSKINSVINELSKKSYKIAITKIMKESLYMKKSAGAKYIIKQIYNKREVKNEKN